MTAGQSTWWDRVERGEQGSRGVNEDPRAIRLNVMQGNHQRKRRLEARFAASPTRFGPSTLAKQEVTPSDPIKVSGLMGNLHFTSLVPNKRK